MSFSYTYDDLVRAVERELGGVIPSPDLVPQWISFAEAWCHRHLDLDCFRESATGTISAGSSVLILPSDYESFIALLVTDDTSVVHVDLVSPDRVTEYSTDETGRPEVCIYPKKGQLVLLPTADADYPYELRYRKRLVSLSEAQQTNELIEDYFDLLLYRTLLYSAPYLYEDKRLTTWASILRELTEDIRIDQWRRDNPFRFRNSRIRIEPY